MQQKRRTFNIGQIGCGSFARGTDFPNYASNPRIQCTWCCDISEEQARRLAADHDVPNITTDYMDVLADPEVDLIKISTSHEVHLPIIQAAAAAGKHVFCEKPLAMDEEDALKIIRAVRRSGIKLCVDLNRRMAPALQVLKTRWQSHLANPRHHPWRHIEVERDPWPEESRSHLLVRVQDDTMSYRIVHLDPLRGGGEIIGETVHWLDVASWMFEPQVPVELQAWGSTRFHHGIHITFSAGDTATILFHTGGTFDYPKELYEMTGQGALFRSQFFVENNYYGIPELERETFPLLEDDFTKHVPEDGFEPYQRKYLARVSDREGRRGRLCVNKGWRAMLDKFLDAIEDDAPSPCDEMAGWLSTHLARLAIHSIQHRQALPVLIEKVKFTVL